MDTSPEYIKQCEKAEEIQKLKTPIVPVSLYRLTSGEVINGNTGDYIANVESNDCVLRYKYIWLPRQDQLQEMVKLHPFELIAKFHSFCMWDEQYEDARENLLLVTMEQLWLVFVMNEKYNKVWNGTDWIEVGVNK